MLNCDRFLLISSPPATGKTSLLQLLYSTGWFEYEYLRCRKDFDPYEMLDPVGLDLKSIKFHANYDELVVILDDAQNIYHHPEFWAVLIKEASCRCPNFRFIISVTHNLNIISESPVALQSLRSRIDRSSLLLTDAEKEELFDLLDSDSESLKPFPTVRQVISNESGGVIGAFVLSVLKVFVVFNEFKSPDETQLLLYYFSKDFFSELGGRVFGTDRQPNFLPEIRNYLAQCFFTPVRKQIFDDHQNHILNQLVKGGALVETGDFYSFSSPLAKRFYIQKIFPTRATEVPSDLRSLVILAIQNMSSVALKMSTVSANDFPKEAVFQHQFMAGLLASLPIDCYVCPEMSKDFPEGKSSSEKIDGEIDFYVNGNLRWGIELLVNGDRIIEHMSRFAEPDGKYVKLNPKDYVVVDFRCSKDGTPTNINQMDKRMCVFFKKGDFSKCIYKFGLDTESYSIDLNS